MATSTYHHGDLPAALRSATAELIAERGPTGFSLQEVARRAGVSHAAPAHHYGSSRGLLTAVATEGFEGLNAAFRTAREGIDDPIDQFGAMGKAYVNHALTNPGHFGVMCAEDLIEDNDAFATASTSAFEQLVEVVTAIATTYNPDLDIDGAAMLAWSMVHGYTTLQLSFQSAAQEKGPGELDEMVERFTSLLMNGYTARS
jgi:AcrR family transcriptional regulator